MKTLINILAFAAIVLISLSMSGCQKEAVAPTPTPVKKIDTLQRVMIAPPSNTTGILH